MTTEVRAPSTPIYLAGEFVEYEAVIPYKGSEPRHVHALYIPHIQHDRVLGCYGFARIDLILESGSSELTVLAANAIVAIDTRSRHRSISLVVM